MKVSIKSTISLIALAASVSVAAAYAQDRHRHVVIIADAGRSGITTDQQYNQALTSQLVEEVGDLGLQYGDRVTLVGIQSASMRGVLPTWQSDITLEFPRARPEDLPEYLTVKMGQLLSDGPQDGVGAVFWGLRYAATRVDCHAMDTSVIVLSTLRHEILVGSDGGLSMDPGQAGSVWSGCDRITFLGAGTDHDATNSVDPGMLQKLMDQYGHSLGFTQVETRW